MLDAPVVVPEHFLTDVGSIPRQLLGLLDAFGRGHEAAVLHDYLYSTQRFPRLMADCLLREALLTQGCPRFLADFVFAVLRLVGALAWNAANDAQAVELPGFVEEATLENLRQAQKAAPALH